MSGTLDAAAAWALVRRLAERVSDEGEAPGRVGEGSGHVLALDTEGRWVTDSPPSAEARAILDLYVPLAVRREFVVGQVGQSLDGRVATQSGKSHYVTGPEDIVRLHRLRALVDAVIVGAGTAVSDRPRLTVRRAEGTNPVRVVLDPNGRVPPEGPMFTDATASTLWVRDGTVEMRLRRHVEVVPPPRRTGDGHVPPSALVALLRERGYRRILVEGGGVTVSSFLTAGALDRLHVTVAPMIIGSGRQGLSLPMIEELEDAMRPACRHFTLGADILFDLDLRADRAGSPTASDSTVSRPAAPPNRSA